MMNRTDQDSSYRAFYESNPSRAARLRDALAKRLNLAGDVALSRKILLHLAGQLDIPIAIVDSDDPVKNIRKIGDGLVGAFSQAGRMKPELRIELVKVIHSIVTNLLADIHEWNTEFIRDDMRRLRRMVDRSTS